MLNRVDSDPAAVEALRFVEQNRDRQQLSEQLGQSRLLELDSDVQVLPPVPFNASKIRSGEDCIVDADGKRHEEETRHRGSDEEAIEAYSER